MDATRQGVAGAADRPAGAAGLSVAGTAWAPTGLVVLPVRVRVFHRAFRGESGAGAGPSPDRRCMGLLHPATGPRRGTHAAADGVTGAAGAAGHACAVWLDARRCAGARRTVAQAELVPQPDVLRHPHGELFCAVVAVPVAVYARRAGQPSTRANRCAWPDRVCAHHLDVDHRLGLVAAAALALLDVRHAGCCRLDAGRDGAGHVDYIAEDGSRGRTTCAAPAGPWQSAADVRAGLVVPCLHAIPHDLDRRPARGERLVHPAHPDQLAGAGMVPDRASLSGAVLRAAVSQGQAQPRLAWC